MFFVNAASIDPEMLNAISGGLLAAEYKFPAACLFLHVTFREILEGNFLAICSPSMRKYSAFR
jgi:hypothetical protein